MAGRPTGRTSMSHGGSLSHLRPTPPWPLPHSLFPWGISTPCSQGRAGADTRGSSASTKDTCGSRVLVGHRHVLPGCKFPLPWHRASPRNPLILHFLIYNTEIKESQSHPTGTISIKWDYANKIPGLVPGTKAAVNDPSRPLSSVSIRGREQPARGVRRDTLRSAGLLLWK